MSSLISRWSEPRGGGCPGIGVYLPDCLCVWLSADQAFLPDPKSPSVSNVFAWSHGTQFPQMLPAAFCLLLLEPERFQETWSQTNHFKSRCYLWWPFSPCKCLKQFLHNYPASQVIMAGKIIISGFFCWRLKASLIKEKLGTHLRDN